MAIKDALIPEFDHEMAVTRKTLERVPEDKPDYKPHEKSMSMSRLAGHVAELPGFVTMALQNDSFNIRPAGGGPARQPLVMSSRKQLLEDFDKNVAGMRDTLSKASDESLMKSWSLMAGDKTILTMPRAARGAQLLPQPHHPSPRAAWRLSAHEQCAGAFGLWTLGG